MHLIGGQPAQKYALEARGTAHFGQGARQCVGPVHLHIPVGANDQQTRSLEVEGKMHEKVKGGPIRPMEVVNYDEEGLRRRRPPSAFPKGCAR